MKTKKELKRDYLEKIKRIGVFQIRNKATGWVYIDHSLDLDKIFNRHLTQLKFGMHHNESLQKDWNQLGETNFAFEILDELNTENIEAIHFLKEVKTLQKLIIEQLSSEPNFKGCY